MARQTDSSSSTMAISGLILLVTNPYFALAGDRNVMSIPFTRGLL
jgi:hypothetical protein